MNMRVAIASIVPRVTIAFALMLATNARCQDVTALDRTITLDDRQHAFLGVERCEDCHKEPSRTRIERGVTDFVALNESVIWLQDVHSKAYELIDPARSKLSEQICGKLGIADIAQARQCLSCHSHWLKGRPRPPTYRRGVACESCHGPSEDWDIPHSREDWRAKPPQEKEQLGMVDVRNPVQRAEQCLSCHIGDVEQGKIVSHEMYAAGHPPLPGIEIESFAKQMPPHWRYLNEKPAFRFRDEFIRENLSFLSRGEDNRPARLLEHHHGAAATVLGGVVALRESIELLSATTLQEEFTWPELSVFNCSTCHHELANPGWRQQAASLPGRPTIHAWPTALARLAILHVSPTRADYDRMLSEFGDKLAAVRDAVEVTPFGKPRQVRTASEELSRWLTDELIVPVSQKPFDNRTLDRSIAMLLHLGGTEVHDYDSARQIAWALRSLYCEMPMPPDTDPQIREALAALSQMLRLNLANAPTETCDSLPIGDRSREILPIASSLPDRLSAAAEFDPDVFRKRMEQLSRLLSSR